MNRVPKHTRLLVIASVLVGLVAGCRNTADPTPLDEALAHYYADQDQQGLETVEAILEADADNAGALALRALFELRSDDSESAHQDATRALELDPNQALAHCALSWYLSDYQDDVDGALAAAEKAIELDPEDPLAYMGRGYIHEKMADPKAAIRDYTEVIERDPQNADAYPF